MVDVYNTGVLFNKVFKYVKEKITVIDIRS